MTGTVIIQTVFPILFCARENTLYLLVLSTVFGSLAFFRISFISFAYGSKQSERLATLAAASIVSWRLPFQSWCLSYIGLGKLPR